MPPFDFKKEFKELYKSTKKPRVVEPSLANFLAVRGKGDPNEYDGNFKKDVAALYSVAYTIKMSKMGAYEIPGYFDFVVPPLEAFWRQDGSGEGILDYARKADLHYLLALRIPEYVDQAVLEWACAEAARKKKIDASKVEIVAIDEGLSIQGTHIGPYDAEPETLELLRLYAQEKRSSLTFLRQDSTTRFTSPIRIVASPRSSKPSCASPRGVLSENPPLKYRSSVARRRGRRFALDASGRGQYAKGASPLQSGEAPFFCSGESAPNSILSRLPPETSAYGRRRHLPSRPPKLRRSDINTCRPLSESLARRGRRFPPSSQSARRRRRF